LLGKLSALGASANAYTSHTHTLYYFSSVRYFEQTLDLYLDAILNPYLENDRC
jgi:predicted Zn-dependent peptidase